MSVGYDVYPRPMVREKGRIIFICTDQTFYPGRLLAFHAWFVTGTSDVRFQIWRPTDVTSSHTSSHTSAVTSQTFTLVKEKRVTPVEGFYQVGF